MIRRFLVPLDGSPFSEGALPVAIDLAKRVTGGEVHLAFVYEPVIDAQGVPPVDPTYGKVIQDGYRTLLDEVIARHRTEGVALSGEVLVGPVVHLLADHAKELAADLIVLTSHGRGGLSRFWLGSTAEGLARHAEVPILLLRPEEHRGITHLDARHVLVPLNGTGFGEAVLDIACSVAGTEGTTYHLVHVIPPVPTLLSAASTTHDKQIFGARATVAKEYLRTMAERLRTRGAAVETELLTGEHVGGRLLAYLDEKPFDLVAMATHGRHGVGRVLIGSVADKILRGTHIPLLLFRPAH